MPDKQEKWAFYDENGKAKGYDEYKLADKILKKKPLKTVPLGDDQAHYQYNGISWDKVRHQRAKEVVSKCAMELLNQQGLYKRNAMENVAKTTVVKSNMDYNPFEPQKTNRIAFENGTYLIDSDELLPFKLSSDNLLNGHKYPAILDKNAPNIEKCGEYMFGNSWQFMKEYLGYCFVPEQKTFQTIVMWMDAEGGRGKGYFIDHIIKPLIGSENISTVSMEQLTGNEKSESRFGTYSLVHKLMNIHADMPKRPIAFPDVLKSLSGGDTQRVEAKGANAFDTENYAKLFFATNHYPKMNVDSALSQRMHIIPSHAPIIRNQPEEQEKRAKLWNASKFKDELGAFAITCIREFKKAKRNGKLSVNDEIKQATKEWEESQDLIAMFLKEYAKPMVDKSKAGTSMKRSYTLFGYWLTGNGIRSSMNGKTFKELLEKKGYKHKKTTEGQTEPDKGNIERWIGLRLDEDE